VVFCKPDSESSTIPVVNWCMIDLPRAFATDITGIKTISVSSDGKLVAAGDSFGRVEVWDLR